MEIADSARKHRAHDQFDDDDIRHAIAHALYATDYGEDADKALYLSPDRAAPPPEVAVVVRADGTELVRDPCHEDAPILRRPPVRRLP